MRRAAKMATADAKVNAIEAKDVAAASNQPDYLTQDEELATIPEAARVVLAGMQQDISERKTYANRIFILICAWVGGMFLLLFAQGLGAWQWLRFSLSAPIILAAIGSTTVNVLGLLYIVVHYLFPNGDRKNAHKK